MPNRSCFPGTASIYNDDGGIIESRIRIRTEGMRKVMIDKTKAWATARKISRKLLGSAPLVPHAEEMHRGSDQVNVGEGHLATSHAFQVVAKTGPCRLPSKTDFVELFRTDPGKFETCLYGVPREAAVMLYATEALFSNGKK